MSLIISEIERLDTLFFSTGTPAFIELGIQDKRQLLETDQFKQYLHNHQWLADIYEASEPLGKVAIASLICIHQADVLLADPDLVSGGWNKWHHFLESMKDLEQFYGPIGGIIGYQRHLLQCLAVQLGLMPSHKQEKITYRKPERIDIRQESEDVRQAIAIAVQQWSKVGFIMPVGGAGDRLGLEDEQGHPLPAAFLPFEGRNLLEGLIRDIEAVELMIEQLTGTRYYTPIALMTSDEKGNHQRIEQMLKDNHYLGRPADTFRLFGQKRVPVITEYGQWATDGPLDPMLKPGGHGVLWRAAEVFGIFDWLKGLGRTHALIRQVNNPMGATDYNLLSLAGFAFKLGKAMGFLSCERLVHATEGVNVWRVREVQDKKYSCITNVEYTDFIQEGIEDEPDEPGSNHSAFSSNTNLFVVKLDDIRQVTTQHAFPGLILNLKSRATVRVGHELQLVRVGRLESMMQNIADYLETEDEDIGGLKQFLLYGDRSKVISVAKNRSPEGGYANETALSAFYDRQMMWRHLLSGRCQMHLSMACTPEEYYQKIPPFVVRISPTLGPLHSWIAKRIRGGTLARGSYLDLDLTHLLMRDVYLDGALRIYANRPQKAYAWLHQVTVVNQGWNEVAPKDPWKGCQKPQSMLEIEFEGAGTFVARQVNFEGARKIVVPDGSLIVASYDELGELVLNEKPMAAVSLPAIFREFIQGERKWLGII